MVQKWSKMIQMYGLGDSPSGKVYTPAFGITVGTKWELLMALFVFLSPTFLQDRGCPTAFKLHFVNLVTYIH